MGANKYNVETQIDFFRKKVDGKPLEYDRMDVLSGEMTPGDIHKVTEQDIQAVRDFIVNEEKNYPTTGLKPLFREWERLQTQYEEKFNKNKAAVTAEAARKVEEEKEKQEKERQEKEKQEKESSARKLKEEREQKNKKSPEAAQNEKASAPKAEKK